MGHILRLAEAGKGAGPKVWAGQEKGRAYAYGLQRPGKGQSLRLAEAGKRAEARKRAEPKACRRWERGSA